MKQLKLELDGSKKNPGVVPPQAPDKGLSIALELTASPAHRATASANADLEEPDPLSEEEAEKTLLENRVGGANP